MDTPQESSSTNAADAPDDRVELTISAGTAIVSVIGDYDLSHADELSTALASAVQCTHLIIDFTRCTLLDSTGIALLIDAGMRARAAAGRLRLVIPPGGAVARVAGLIRLADLVPISEELEDALGARPA